MIYPMFVMVLLTFLVGCAALYTRVNSVRTQHLKPQDFKLMDAEQFPDSVTKTTRNFNNQFEIPVLFYVAGLAYLALGVSSHTVIILAWGFVISRVVHAYIHITYNHLMHRMLVFWLGVFMVMGMWVTLLFNIH